jgi:hypothetical protein
MSSLLKEKKGIGVIVCRMQVPYLTPSHRSLIDTVRDRHRRVIIFLGTTNNPIDSKNPFPFEFRKKMILSALGEDNDDINIVPIPDQVDDNASWVKILDQFIQTFLAYDEEPILYGGRDSFIQYYRQDNGKFKCVELSPNDYDSGTVLRQLVSIEQPGYSLEAAAAILWTIRQLNQK